MAKENFDFGDASFDGLSSGHSNTATKLSNMRKNQQILREQATESKRIMDYYSSRQGKADMMKNLRRSIDKAGSKLYSNNAIQGLVKTIEGINASGLKSLASRITQGQAISSSQAELFGNYVNEINSFLGKINDSVTVIEKGSSVIQRLANIVGDTGASANTKINAIQRASPRLQGMAEDDSSGFFSASFNEFKEMYKENEMIKIGFQKKIYDTILKMGMVAAATNAESQGTLEGIQQEVGDVNLNTDKMTSDGFLDKLGKAFVDRSADKIDLAGTAIGDKNFSEMNDLIQGMTGQSIGGLAQKGISGIFGAGKGVLDTLRGTGASDEIAQYRESRESGGIHRTLEGIHETNKNMLLQLVSLVGITKMAALFSKLGSLFQGILSIIGPGLAIAGIGGLGVVLGKQIAEQIAESISSGMDTLLGGRLGKKVRKRWQDSLDNALKFTAKIFQEGPIDAISSAIDAKRAERSRKLFELVGKLRKSSPQFRAFRKHGEFSETDQFFGALSLFHPDAPESDPKFLPTLQENFGRRFIGSIQQDSKERSKISQEQQAREFAAFKTPPPSIINSGNKSQVQNYFTDKILHPIEAE